MVTVTPIEGENGRLGGALVGTARIPNLTGPLLITVGVSAVLLTIPAAFLGLIFGFFTAWGITRRIGGLARAAQAGSRGDFSGPPKDPPKDAVGQPRRAANKQ